LNNAPKHIASTTLSEPLPWQNSTLPARARLGPPALTDGGAPASLSLVDATPTTSGVVIATYQSE
jgi:hypothetical protein